MNEYFTHKYETEKFTNVQGYLVASAASVFGILFYHFCHKAANRYRAAGWISLLFQSLITGIFLTGFSFARMTNFDLLHGLALGYYIAGLLFYQSKASVIYHICFIVLLIVNATEYNTIGLPNFPIMLVCICKCGDLLGDILYLQIQYSSPPDIINLSAIFEIFVSIYSIYLTRIIFPSTYSKIYNFFGIIILGMSTMSIISSLIRRFSVDSF